MNAMLEAWMCTFKFPTIFSMCRSHAKFLSSLVYSFFKFVYTCRSHAKSFIHARGFWFPQKPYSNLWMYYYFLVNQTCPNILWIKAKAYYSHVVGFCGRMTWPRLTSPNYESLIVVELAHNHGHYFSLDDDKALLESLVRGRWLPSYRCPSVRSTTYQLNSLHLRKCPKMCRL